jgi:hypothetical protein
MRINVYSQELTKEIVPITKKADTGIVYYGIRLMLAFDEMAMLVDEIAELTRSIPDPKPND